MICDRHTHAKFEFGSFSQYSYSDIPSYRDRMVVGFSTTYAISAYLSPLTL